MNFYEGEQGPDLVRYTPPDPHAGEGAHLEEKS
jgi:hypothetical protein